MAPSTADPIAETLAFVRGEQDWRSLERIGVSISFRGNRIAVVGGIVNPVIVTARDVATGWLRLVDHRDDLRRWAQVLMGAVSIIELDFQDTGEEDALKDALWQVSFGGAATSAMEHLARRILLTGHGNPPNP